MFEPVLKIEKLSQLTDGAAGWSMLSSYWIDKRASIFTLLLANFVCKSCCEIFIKVHFDVWNVCKIRRLFTLHFRLTPKLFIVHCMLSSLQLHFIRWIIQLRRSNYESLSHKVFDFSFFWVVVRIIWKIWLCVFNKFFFIWNVIKQWMNEWFKNNHIRLQIS